MYTCNKRRKNRSCRFAYFEQCIFLSGQNTLIFQIHDSLPGPNMTDYDTNLVICVNTVQTSVRNTLNITRDGFEHQFMYNLIRKCTCCPRCLLCTDTICYSVVAFWSSRSTRPNSLGVVLELNFNVLRSFHSKGVSFKIAFDYYVSSFFFNFPIG